jgi:hypothetical protein
MNLEGDSILLLLLAGGKAIGASRLEDNEIICPCPERSIE